MSDDRDAFAREYALTSGSMPAVSQAARTSW